MECSPCFLFIISGTGSSHKSIWFAGSELSVGYLLKSYNL
jgi:hypothetical protein